LEDVVIHVLAIKAYVMCCRLEIDVC